MAVQVLTCAKWVCNHWSYTIQGGFVYSPITETIWRLHVHWVYTGSCWKVESAGHVISECFYRLKLRINMVQSTLLVAAIVDDSEPAAKLFCHTCRFMSTITNLSFWHSSSYTICEGIRAGLTWSPKNPPWVYIPRIVPSLRGTTTVMWCGQYHSKSQQHAWRNVHSHTSV